MKEWVKTTFGCLIMLLFLTGLFTLPFSIPFVVDGLSSEKRLERIYLINEYYELKEYDEITESVLTNFLYKRSKCEVCVGAICNDGWVSYSTGHGTCSHHGGVSTWKYETTYKRTYQDCNNEAIELIRKCRNKAFDVSWID